MKSAAMLNALDDSSLDGVSPALAFQTIRMANDLQTAYFLALSAYTRTGSIGCHVRTDSDDADEKYRVVIRNTPAGAQIIKETI